MGPLLAITCVLVAELPLVVLAIGALSRAVCSEAADTQATKILSAGSPVTLLSALDDQHDVTADYKKLVQEL